MSDAEEAKGMTPSAAFAKVLLLVRHVRNLHELGSHPIRAEAIEAEKALARALGKQGLERVFRTRAWRDRGRT